MEINFDFFSLFTIKKVQHEDGAIKDLELWSTP